MEHLLVKNDLIRYADNIERTTWLGFDHDRWLDRSPVDSWEAYVLQSDTLCQFVAGWEKNLQNFSIGEIAFLQSLTSIGIWEVLLQRKLRTGFFLRGFCPGATFSTEKVPSLLFELCWSINSNRNPSRMSLMDKNIISILSFMSRLDGILVNLAHPRYSHVIHKLRRQVVLLTEAFREVTEYLPRFTNLSCSVFRHIGANSDFYGKKLQMIGFCPANFGVLDYMGQSSLEYFLIAGRDRFDKPIAQHHSCDPRKCYHWKHSGISQPQVRHVGSTCQDDCDFLAASAAIIAHTLKSGNYFVLDISRIKNASYIPDDAIVPHFSGLQYVAFSHVWTHGLASDSDTGLPICQLEKLCRILQQTELATGLHAAYIWIDSLCIPRDYDLKMRSISMMSQIYRNAAVVVALDAFLETINYEDTPRETSALFIVTSEWNKRLWTFQEAKLANRLMFVFKKSVESLDILQKDLLHRAKRGEGTAVTFQCIRWLEFLSAKSNRIFDWLDMFQFKACSVPDDESLVISNLIGLNTEALVCVKGPMRMARLWLMLSIIPKGLLFHSGSKLGIERFRWAPDSFLLGSGETAVGSEEARVTRHGLRGRYIVVDLQSEHQRDFSNPQWSELLLRVGRFAIHCFPRESTPYFNKLPVNAVALIRYPDDHWNSIPDTPISAAALLKLHDQSTIPIYRFQFQLLGTVRPISCSSSVIPEEREIIIQ